jgi:hypothetical protein
MLKTRLPALVAAVTFATMLAGPLEAQLTKASATENIACGSSWNARRTCTTSGYIERIDLVRDLSGRCRLNSTWGATRSEIWTSDGCRGDFRVLYRGDASTAAEGFETMTCGRTDGTQAECRLDANATRIRLVRNLGRSSCQQGSNWGYSNGVLWTNRGCRGEFEVSYAGNAAIGATPTRVMTCGSQSDGRILCDARGTISTARLVNELSKGRCRPGLTWGFSSTEIWTTNSCQGEFEVSYR